MFSTAVYLINRLPSPVLHGKSPHKSLFQRQPDYSFLWVFGSACWPNLRPFNKHKLDYQSTLYVFLSYNPDYKGYKCLNQSIGSVYVSRDVVFVENTFPFASSPPQSTPVSFALLLPFPLTTLVVRLLIYIASSLLESPRPTLTPLVTNSPEIPRPASSSLESPGSPSSSPSIPPPPP